MRPNPHFPVDLVIFTEEIFHGKLLFFLQWKSHLIRLCEDSTLYKSNTSRVYFVDHLFGTFAKFSEKLRFLTLWYAHIYVLRNVKKS